MKSAALVDDRTSYVTVRINGAAEPVWRSAWLTSEVALKLRDEKREEAKRAGWRAVVEAFFRDGEVLRG